MKSLISCARCGKKPRVLARQQRPGWSDGAGGGGSSPVRAGAQIVSGSPAAGRREMKTGAAPVEGEAAGREPLVATPGQEKLSRVFDFYCQFAPVSTALDNAKWFKCINEMGLIDNRTLSRPEVDLIFSKVKAKGERRLAFAQFCEGMLMIARKKAGRPESDAAPEDEADLAAILAKANVEASVAGTTVPVKSSIVDRLTDTKLYTGAHKQRFDEDGRGRGLEGRDSVSKGAGGHGVYHGGAVSDLSQITRSNLARTGGGVARSDAMARRGVSPMRTPASSAGASSRTPVRGSPSPSRRPVGSSTPASASPKKKSNIFDRLTDTSTYTGAHKHRFDADGRGRGIAGRDIGVDRSKVSDLSQITRPGMR